MTNLICFDTPAIIQGLENVPTHYTKRIRHWEVVSNPGFGALFPGLRSQ